MLDLAAGALGLLLVAAMVGLLVAFVAEWSPRAWLWERQARRQADDEEMAMIAAYEAKWPRKKQGGDKPSGPKPVVPEKPWDSRAEG